jgi:glutamate-1-semialdehyde 2,1-aminomutase
LIFDEIITGSRIARGGAQERYDVKSDITTLSKAAIGGFPGSIIGGKKEIMRLLVDNRVFHGGVYSGNPLTLSVTLATQKEHQRNGTQIFADLNRRSDLLSNGMRDLFKESDIPVCVNNVGAMISLFFLKESGRQNVESFRDYVKADKIKHIYFQHILQDMGVYSHPNNLEPWYLSTAHTDEIIYQTLEIMRKAIMKFKDLM